MTALPDPDTDPTRYVLAVADMRDRDAHETTLLQGTRAWHAAEVALWRRIADRHRLKRCEFEACVRQHCGGCSEDWVCPDLLAVVAVAKAYAGAP